MNLICDNDAVVKLAQCELLPDLVNCFGPDAKCYVTETFAPWLRGRIQKRRVPEFVQESVHSLFPQTLDLQKSQLCHLDRLISPGIDPGEAMIFAAAVGTPSVVVCTGDKTAIRALAAHPDIAEYRDDFRGKLLCLEQAMLTVIKSQGFDSLKRKVVAALAVDSGIDKAVLAAFGSGDDTTETNATCTLQAYVDELAAIAGDLLYPL